ncbi:GtrA family protein [uncultured Maricaulis sp.]|uniref:GtrA family protein n=1 Tax=uncultured Maricaulis sp. TaxID=174710 RepID=UPI0034588C07
MQIIDQIFKFLSVGAINTILGLVIIFALQLSGVDYLLANLSGYAAGLLFSFLMNRFWSFRVRGSVTLLELARFLITFLAAYTSNLIVVAAFVEILDVSVYISQVIGVVVYAVVNFVGLKCVVFNVR